LAEGKLGTQNMRDVDIKTVDAKSLVDIRKVEVNNKLSREKRVQDYIKKIGNPYVYRHDDYIVKISFTETTATLTDRLRELILRTANESKV